VNKKLIDLAIAIFLDNLMLKIYFDGEAYTRTGVCVCVCVAYMIKGVEYDSYL
jgi:hypothetical protein